MPMQDPNGPNLQSFKHRWLPCCNSHCQKTMQGILSYETRSKRTICYECEQEEIQALSSLEPQDVENETNENLSIWIN